MVLYLTEIQLRFHIPACLIWKKNRPITTRNYFRTQMKQLKKTASYAIVYQKLIVQLTVNVLLKEGVIYKATVMHNNKENI